MRNTLFFISFVSILISSIISCSSESLPFLKGKYMLWLGVLCLIAFVVAIRNDRKTFKITIFDGILLALAVFGTSHFLFFSKATIYNSEIWNYIGYLALYFILRHQCSTVAITKKTLSILLYFCSTTAVFNIFLMFLQWKHWIAAPNQFFLTTGMFFSPNQLGIYLSIGLLSTFFLWQINNVLWMRIALGLGGILIFIGLCVTESRGAFISLLVALGYYCSPPLPSPKGREPKLEYFKLPNGMKPKSLFNWKIYIGIVVLLVAGLYFFSTVNKNKTESTSGRWFTTTQVLKQIVDQPFGYGLNSFSVEYNKAKAAYFERNTTWEEMKNAGYIYKANNDFLELTFELGIAWMVLFLFFIVLFFWKKGNSLETRMGRTLLLCLLLFSLTTSILITPVLVIIACVCAVSIGNTTNPKVLYEFENRSLFGFLVMGLIGSFVFVIISRINAEYKLFRLYEDKMYLKSESQLRGYISKIDDKGEEFFMGGLTLTKNGSIDEGFDYLQIGFERSGRPSLGRVLANGLKQQKKYAAAEEIFTYNKNVEPYRYEARMDLFNLFIETKQDTKAKAMAQEIIQLPVKIPSPTIEAYKKKAQAYLDESSVTSKTPPTEMTLN